MGFRGQGQNRVKKNAKKTSQGYFFASCPKGLEDLLEKEVREQKVEEVEKSRGGVRFKAENKDALHVLLQSRVASRVFKEMHFFPFIDEQDLFEQALKKWWHKIFRLEQTFKINTLFDLDASHFFRNSMLLSQKLKDAIVDQFREELNDRPSVDTKNPDLSFLLRIEAKERGDGWNATVLLDMCGEPLSNRGYRAPGHRAPLRENLAAALVMTTDWDPDKDIFVDPMCGSGTILLEAIMIKAKLPPSYLKVRKQIERNNIKQFALLNHHWFTHDKELKKYFEDELSRIYNFTLETLNELHFNQFFGSDDSYKSLDIARENFKNAYLDPELVTLERADACEVAPQQEAPGVVICNPPYGERLGEEDQLGELYHDFGENLKNNFKGYRGYVFTSRPDLRKRIALQTSERIKFYNGSIECRLLRYELR